jgi:hypothetical protein
MSSVAGLWAIYWNAWVIKALTLTLISSFLDRHLATPTTKTCRYHTSLLAVPIQTLRIKLMTSVKCFLPVAHTEA